MRLLHLLSITFFISITSISSQSLSIGYLGNNIWNPGIEVSMSKKINKLNFKSDLAAYLDPGSHSAIFANVGIEKSYKKWSIAASPIGIYRSFLANTYVVLDDGSIASPKSTEGNFFYSPSLSIYRNHFEKIKSKIQILILTPYNSHVMPLINFGVSYQIMQEKSKN